MCTNIKVKLNKKAYMPNKAHTADAGFDLRTPTKVRLNANSSVVIDTGVHMLIPEGYFGLLASKSGLNVKNSITGTGVIDAGYTGSIIVKLYNDDKECNYIFEKGDKIIQILILPVPDVILEQVDNFDVVTERGDTGFGASGK